MSITLEYPEVLPYFCLKESSENDNFKFHTRGIAKRNASISYTLAPTADADNVKVSFNDGILKVVVPVKKEELDKFESELDAKEKERE